MALFHLSQIPLRERNNCDSEAMKMALLNPLTTYVVRKQLDIQPRDGSVSASQPTWRGNKISSPRHLFVCSVCLSEAYTAIGDHPESRGSVAKIPAALKFNIFHCFLHFAIFFFFFYCYDFTTENCPPFKLDNATEPVFVNLLRSPGIDSQPGGVDPWNRFLGSINVNKYGLCTVVTKMAFDSKLNHSTQSHLYNNTSK